jgi:hypothetical protein
MLFGQLVQKLKLPDVVVSLDKHVVEAGLFAGYFLTRVRHF